MNMQIRKAERIKSKIRIGIAGASGSGKTWSALEIAYGMSPTGKIGFIDTESGRGDIYADLHSKHDESIKFNYDIIRLEKPYSVERYIEAIHMFEQNAYDVIIIDSLSHAWTGDGGILQLVENSTGTNKFTSGWKKAGPIYNSLVDTIINSPSHIICTFRSKIEYALQLNAQGKHIPIKVGLAPVQRDGFEYEFTVFMMLNQDNVAHVSKDNTEIFHSLDVKPSPEMGRKYIEWIESGSDIPDPKTIFFQKRLPEIILKISESETIPALQKTFSDAWRECGENYSEYLPGIVEAKNARKKLLDVNGRAM